MDDTRNAADRTTLMQAVEDREGLAPLVVRYRAPLFHFAFRFVGDRETAEDIVQETFLRCLKHSHQYADIVQVATWLYTIAGNLAKSELRRRKIRRWVPIGPREDDENMYFYEPVDKGQLPGEQTDTKTVHQAVSAAIEKLPEEYREAVLLRDLNNLSYEDIAKITKAPIGTVKSRVNRGRIRLQKELHGLAREVIGPFAAGVG